MSGRLHESQHPVIDQLRATLGEPRVCTTELRAALVAAVDTIASSTAPMMTRRDITISR
jgi:hypothetical protein